jgi:putative ABC transport system ATP-binding protein
MDKSIDLTGIEFAWDTSPVLKLDAFSVDRGEKVFVGGPSGVGKSSLLSVLSGVAVPQTGSVKLLGQELSGMRGAERDGFRADHIGYIFQMFNLVPFLSVVENVTLPLRYSKKRSERVGDAEAEAIRLLEHLGMAEFSGKRVMDLSVGQQQRVAAARALIGKPEIVLADEPTSALDKENSKAFVELLFEECAEAGSSLVFVSHDPDLAPMFDRSFLLGGEV